MLFDGGFKRNSKLNNMSKLFGVVYDVGWELQIPPVTVCPSTNRSKLSLASLVYCLKRSTKLRDYFGKVIRITVSKNIIKLKNRILH